MKVVYHHRYEEVYTGDPAAAPGRMESIIREVKPHFDVIEPEPANIEDIRMVHTEDHIAYVRRQELAYDIALLAAGGAITAAGLAMAGEPSFGLIRPPGHHASPDRSWGFCYFNNVAIAIEKLRRAGEISKAVILDIDLHFGDGTDNFFRGMPDVVYFHPDDLDRMRFADDIARFLSGAAADVISVSAGFDRHEHDWGEMLTTDDYQEIGRMVRDFADRACDGRRFGVLEGGYNHTVLGQNVRAFMDGMK